MVHRAKGIETGNVGEYEIMRMIGDLGTHAWRIPPLLPFSIKFLLTCVEVNLSFAVSSITPTEERNLKILPVIISEMNEPW